MIKPLLSKAYGSIAHLPISKMGQSDKRIHFGQAIICLEKFRDKHDHLIVQEKLDGSCVAVAKIDGQIRALTRAGYICSSSPHKQHHLFDSFVKDNSERFDAVLKEGERLVGEWLIQAHGTVYNLPHEPFVAFDLITTYNERLREYDFYLRVMAGDFVTPQVYHRGPPLPLHHLAEKLKTSGHGANQVEGAIYRVERQGKVDFLAKFVRPDYVPGKYLEVTQKDNPNYKPTWNQVPT